MTNNQFTNDYLTIHEEIEGLTYLAKYEPFFFTPADEQRLQMLKNKELEDPD